MFCYEMSPNITIFHEMFHLECYHPDVIKCYEMPFNLKWWHLMICHDAVNLIQRGIFHSIPLRNYNGISLLYPWISALMTQFVECKKAQHD